MNISQVLYWPKKRSLFISDFFGKKVLTKNCLYIINILKSAPEIKPDHPLNLSILFSGGKETNKDCLSRGD